MSKDINISIDTIKRHSKRLHKVLQSEGIITQEFKLTAIQEIFSKALGCNNWFELNEILKQKTEEKSQINSLVSLQNEYYLPLVMIIDSSLTIQKTIALFLDSKYDCISFSNTDSALNNNDYRR